MSNYNPIIRKPKSHLEWLTERNKGIGSSEIGVIMGVSNFMTPYELYVRKTSDEYKEEQNDMLTAGHMLEPIVAQYFELNTGKHVIKSSAGDWVAIDPARPWLRVSPDRLYYRNGKSGERGILECKTTQKVFSADDIPPSYFCQVQYQLGVMGLNVATLAWLRSGYDFKYCEIEFNPEFYRLMTDKATEWWLKHIEQRVPPEPVTAEDVRKYIPPLKDTEAEASDETIGVINRLREINLQIKQLEACKAELQDRIATAIGAAESLVALGTDGSKAILATFKEQSRTSVDTKRLKEDHPDIVDGYSKTTTSRVLRVQ